MGGRGEGEGIPTCRLSVIVNIKQACRCSHVHSFTDTHTHVHVIKLHSHIHVSVCVKNEDGTGSHVQPNLRYTRSFTSTWRRTVHAGGRWRPSDTETGTDVPSSGAVSGVFVYISRCCGLSRLHPVNTPSLLRDVCVCVCDRKDRKTGRGM